MKKFIFSMLTIASFAVSSCSGDDNGGGTDPADDDPPVTGEEITKTGFITADETWAAENIYVLDGKVIVGDGIT
ncbi:MAG: hypothetical protein GYB37_11095, partial [Algicola sp.]|nr:hypothetical protein [Algicola sp.]